MRGLRLSGKGVSTHLLLIFKLFVFAVVLGEGLYLLDVSLGHTREVGVVWRVEVVWGGGVLMDAGLHIFEETRRRGLV